MNLSEDITDARKVLRVLYYGDTENATRFRYGLLALDLAMIAYFIFTSFVEVDGHWKALDYLLAIVIGLELSARIWVHDHRLRYAFQFTSIADVLVILSLAAPLVADNLAFLRVVRMLRLMRSYHVVAQLRKLSPFFKRNEETIQSSANLVVFIFVITAIVYVAESARNPAINNYVDALYFTVTTLTTTGFGDITLTGTSGRLLAVAIMVIGLALFLRLLQTIFRPEKVRITCQSCGLARHDPDAVHCKHCGAVMNIPDEDYA